MSAIQLLLQAEAAERSAAARRRVYRHVHIDPAPLVITTYNLSGEAAAPIAFMYGTSVADAQVCVAPEPRNRALRFEAIHEFALGLEAYMATKWELEKVTTSKGKTFENAVEVPQIWTPNRGTREFLGARLGRSLRYLDRGDNPATTETVWAGSYLSWMEEQRHYPGQNLFLAATEELTRHFATGQSALEDENLAVLLAWITNKPDSGPSAIRTAEEGPAFGPVPDPELEEELERLLRASAQSRRDGDTAAIAQLADDVTALVAPPLTESFEATLRAIDVLSRIPEAASVAKRAAEDRRRWSWYLIRTKSGIPRFRRRHTAIQAARLIEEWTHAAEHLEADEAFDDPLVMAELDAAGRCMFGTVVTTDPDNSEIKQGNSRRSLVPLVTLKLTAPTRLLAGDFVTWAEERKVGALVREVRRDGTVVLALMEGHNRGTVMPQARSDVMFVDLRPFGGLGPQAVDEIPWTHRSPLDDDGPTTITSDETGPNLSAADIAALPLVDLSDPDLVPGVVL